MVEWQRELEIYLSTSDDLTAFKSRYHPTFVDRAHALDGMWWPGEEIWTFDSAKESALRVAANEVFGTDGQPTDAAHLLLRINDLPESCQSEAWFAGRSIARRDGKRVVLGPGVRIVRGGFASDAEAIGLLPAEGTTLEIREVPLRLVSRIKKAHPTSVKVVGKLVPEEDLSLVIPRVLDRIRDLQRVGSASEMRALALSLAEVEEILHATAIAREIAEEQEAQARRRRSELEAERCSKEDFLKSVREIRARLEAGEGPHAE